MLKAVAIHPIGAKFDLGAMAEAAVYFGQGILVLRFGALADLVDQLGWALVHELLDLGDIRIEVDDLLFAAMRTEPMIEISSLFVVGEGSHLYLDAQEAIQERLIRKLGITKHNRIEAGRLCDRLVYRTIATPAYGAVEDDMGDAGLTFAVAAQIAHDCGSVAGTKFEFRLESSTDFEQVWSCDTDFPAASSDTPSQNPLAPHQVALAIYDSNREVLHSANGATDLWLQPRSTSVLRAKVESLALRSQTNVENIRVFEDVLFDKVGIAAAVRAGERTPRELLEFLQNEDTRRWKSWISQQAPDVKLMTEYGAAIKSSSAMFEGVPWVGARMLINAATGLVVSAAAGGNPVLGIAASVAQEVLLGAAEKQLKAAVHPWQPSLWVDGPARSFTRSNPM